MSIKTELESLSSRIQTAYDVCQQKGAVIPQTRDTYHLSSTIESIPTGSVGNTLKDFFRYNKITEINDNDVPSELTSLKSYALTEQTALSSISISNLKSIGTNGLNKCSNLLSVNFPNVKSISTGSFAYCSKLSSLSFPELTSITIGGLGSANCPPLTSLNIGKTTSFTGSSYLKYLQDFKAPELTSNFTFYRNTGSSFTDIKRIHLPSMLSSSTLAPNIEPTVAGGTSDILEFNIGKGKCYNCTYTNYVCANGFTNCRRIVFGRTIGLELHSSVTAYKYFCYPYQTKPQNTSLRPALRDWKVMFSNSSITGWDVTYTADLPQFYEMPELRRIYFYNNSSSSAVKLRLNMTRCPKFKTFVIDTPNGLGSVSEIYTSWFVGMPSDIALYVRRNCISAFTSVNGWTSVFRGGILAIEDHPEVLEDFDIYE